MRELEEDERASRDHVDDNFLDADVDRSFAGRAAGGGEFRCYR